MSSFFKALSTLILCALFVLAMSVGVVFAIVIMLGFKIADLVTDGIKALRRRLA